MAVENRIDSLRTQHADLEDQIHDESTKPMPDDARLAELKRQKLRVNDEIQRLTGTLEAG